MNDEKFKQTAGKPRISLVPPALIESVARVRTYAVANKYSNPDGWRKVPVDEFVSAIGRHYAKMLRYGTDAVDAETGEPHTAHIACNCAFLLELLES